MDALNYNQRLEIKNYFAECIRNYGIGGYESTLAADENGDLYYEFSDRKKIKADDYSEILGYLYDDAVNENK